MTDGDVEVELLVGVADDLQFAIGRLQRSSRRLGQLAELSLRQYVEFDDMVAAALLAVEKVEAAVRARRSVLQASSRS